MKSALLPPPAFCLALCFWLASCAAPGNDLQTSRRLMDSGQTAQAAALLEKRVHDQPMDYEAYFLLGSAFVRAGDYARAEDAFSSAARLNPIYDVKISAEYAEAGMAALEAGDYQKADFLFEKASRHRPRSREEIAARVFDKGAARVAEGKNAIDPLRLAARLDPGLEARACDLYFDAGKSLSGMKQALYFEYSLQFCDAHKAGIAPLLCDFYFQRGEKAAGESRVHFFRQSVRHGEKHLPAAGRLLLADADAVADPLARAQFLIDLKDLLADDEILESSLRYFGRRFKETRGIDAAPARVVLDGGEWVGVPGKKIGTRDTVAVIGTVSPLNVRVGEHVARETPTVYMPSEVVFPGAGSGGVLHFQNASYAPGVIYYWVYAGK